MAETPEQNAGGGAPPPPPQQPPMQAPPTGGSSQNKTLMLILAYLGLLAVIPLLAEKEDDDVQWHAKHGLVLAACCVVLFVALWIVIFVISYLIPPVGCLLSVGMPLIFLALFALDIFLIIKAVGGERVRLPVVTDLAEKWK